MENSPNLAPLEPLEQHKQQRQFIRKDPVEFFSALRQEMRKEGESEEWVSRLMASQKNEFYYRGYQRLRKADLSKTYEPLPGKPVHFTFNEFQFWTNVNVAKWIASRVDYRFSGLGDTPDQEMAANKLRNIATSYDAKYWDRTKVIAASKTAQFTGYVIGYVYYDPEAEAGKAYRPVTDRKPVKLGNDAYRCVDCGHIAELEQDAQPICAGPDCQSPNLAVTEVPEFEAEIETGKEEYHTGDVCCDLISLYNIRWNARLGLEKSPIVLWEEEYDKDDLEATYEGLEIPQAKTDDVGLRAKARLEHLNESESGPQARVTLSRMWVEPRRYTRIELEKPIKTYAGVEFAVGTKLIEIFPDGCHVIMMGNLIVDLYSAIKNDDLHSMGYHTTASGGLAQGNDAMCEPQRNTNTGFSLWNLWLRHHASPPKRYNPELVDAGDMAGDPTRPYPINPSGIREGQTIENAVVADLPTPFPNGVFQGLQEMRNFIQFAANATEFSEGLPGVKNETYGGAKLAQSVSQSVSSTVLAQFADFRVGIIKRVLKKFRQYCWDQRYIEYSGTYGQIEGQYLSSVDIPNTFEVTAVQNSWFPRTPEQRQNNIQGFLQAVGGVVGMLNLPPKILSEYLEIFDIDFGDDIFPVTVRVVRWRIKQAMELLPQMQMLEQMMAGIAEEQPMVEEAAPVEEEEPMPDEGIPGAPPAAPMQPITVGMQLFAALQPPFNPRERGLMEMAEYLSTWLLTDEGLNAPPEIREEFIAAYQDACLSAQAMQQMALGALAMAGQPMPVEGDGGDKSKGNGKPPGPPQQSGAMSAGAG